MSAPEPDDDGDDGWVEDDERDPVDVTDRATGRARVLSRKCRTCVLYRDDRMHLRPGRRESFVRDAAESDRFVVCHATLGSIAPADYPGNAVCRGFWDEHRADVWPLRLVQLLGGPVYVDPPEGH